jgi:folate-binding protein YgfZ
MSDSSNKIFDRPPKAILRISGEDAFSFLQGQFSNELRHSLGSATYGLWLNQKGKVVADSTVLTLAENEFLLCSEGCSSDLIQHRLEGYVVADDVAVIPAGRDIAGLSLWGGDCGTVLDKVLGARPAHGQFMRGGEIYVFQGQSHGEARYRAFGPQSALNDLSLRLTAAGFTAVGASEFEWDRISSGVLTIPQDLGATDLPNEGGLENTALSYTKGCYLGQEVMARLKNLGQVRRRLFVVRGDVPLPPSPCAVFQGGTKMGELRSVAFREQRFVAFAMLSLVNLDQSGMLAFAADGPASILFGVDE